MTNHAAEFAQRSSYSAMGKSRDDYEPCYFRGRFEGQPLLHCHDFFEMYIHYGGGKVYCVGKDVYPLKPNHLMIFPPFYLHGLLDRQVLEDYERAYLYISPSLLKKAGCGRMDLHQLFTRYAERGQYQFLMRPDAALHCKEQIQLMIDGLQDTSALGSYTNFVRMLSFLQTVAQTVVHTTEKREPLAVNDPMHEVLTYINEHYVQHITLEELARHFGISASLLSHKFVMYTGRSVYDYVLYRRVLQAKEMINSSLALSEVAYQCGFNDYSCFLRAFRRVTGMSPNAYRKYAKELFQ